MNNESYVVYYVNFGYYAAPVFPTIEAALQFAQRHGYEAAVYPQAYTGPGCAVAAYHPINGSTIFQEDNA